MHNNTKTTTFSVKKGYTYTTALKEKHLVCRKVTPTQQQRQHLV